MEQRGTSRVRLGKKTRDATSRPTRIRGHNFAIMLLQTLEARVASIAASFKALGELRGRNNYYVDRKTFIQVLLAAAEMGPANPDEESWVAGIAPDDLASRIGDIFDGSDPHNIGKVCLEDMMSYVIDCSLYGDVGHVPEPIPEFVASSGGAFPNLEEMSKARYAPEIGKVLTTGKMLGVVNPVTLQAQCITPYNVKDKLSRVYDADYIPHMQAALVVGTDLNIDLVAIESGRTIFRVPTTDTHSVCAYDRGTSKALVARSSTVELFSVFAQRNTDVKFLPVSEFEHHKDLVYRILPMPQIGMVATGSADKTAVVTDCTTGAMLTQFTGHTSAVHCLRFVTYMNMMASVAFDTEPRLWMLGSRSRSDAFTLRDMDIPHTGHVVDLCTADEAPIVASLDTHGLLKIWDIRTMKCRQNISPASAMSGIFDAGTLGWHSLVWDSPRGELVACAKHRIQKVRLKVPRFGKTMIGSASKGNTTHDSVGSGSASSENQAPEEPVGARCGLADEFAIVVICPNNTNQTLLTCSERHVRVWDVFTGKQEAAFEHLVPASTVIAASCVSCNGQTFFIGLRNGQVTQHLYSNGAVVRLVTPDGGPAVLQLVYLESCQTLATITARGCMLSYDRMAANEPDFFPDYEHSGSTKLAFYDPVLQVFGASGRKSHVTLFESRRRDFTPDGARTCGGLSTGQNEISCALLLHGYPVVAVTTSAGTLALYTTAPHPAPNKKFAETLMKSRDLLQLAFYPPKAVLYAADDQGFLHAFVLTDALATVGIINKSTSWAGAVTSVGRSGCLPRETTVISPSMSARGHLEMVTGLAWIRGANVLASSGSDKRVLMWTLGLGLIGELDPNVETGKYSIPVAVVASDEHSYVTECAFGENILFAGMNRRSSSSPLMSGIKNFRRAMHIKGRNDAAAGDSADVVASGMQEQRTAANQSKFAEDVHRIAMELESFLPSKAQLARAQLDSNRVLALGSLATAEEGDAYGKEALVCPAVELGSGTQRLAPSSNSCGVHFRSLFSLSPLLPPTAKAHVVCVGGGEEGGDRFSVTQNHPLPPHFRTERALILRELVQQEQLRLSHAADQHQLRQGQLVPRALPLDVPTAAASTPVREGGVATSPVGRWGVASRQGALRLPTASDPALLEGNLKRSAAAVSALLPCDLIRLHSSSQQRSGRGLDSRAAKSRRSLTPQPHGAQGISRLDDNTVDWAGCRASHAHAYTPQPVVNGDQLNRTTTTGSTSRGRFSTLEDVAESCVGFGTFGVRSLQSVLSASAEGQPWARTHRVELPGPLEVPVLRPQSISSQRGL